MSYRLVITEKPSVAQAYAKVLGATSRQDSYLEGGGYLVSWCVGHLVELAPPNLYDEKYVKWSVADLPILPEKWQYLVSASTKRQFGILKKLMHREDVESIVCATDAGREGELIFRLVYQQAGCKKPVSRLWLSSMEDAAIREGFARLKPSTEYDALYNAALCRERADWMVGINATRLFSCLYGHPLAVGRVMTPTLAMTVVREAAISAFVPEKFYTVALALAEGSTASSKRFSQKADAEALLSACRKEASTAVQKVERKEKAENPPLLYDLTTLQRDANRLLGFTAQQTLTYAQSLYEKKLITYPRTDSRFLTEDMAASLPDLVTESAKAFGVEDTIPVHAQQFIDGRKVTDHHALLPTASMAKADLSALPAGELSILRLISVRLFCAVGEPHRYAETTLTTTCAGEEFTAKGKVVLSEGWKSVERTVLSDILGKKKEPPILPDVQEQSECGISGTELKEGNTSPPHHFTEDTLLHSMETASAESMPEGVERQGIGTPATRAATIEKLVAKGFLERKGDKKTKALLPTDKGKALITVIHTKKSFEHKEVKVFNYVTEGTFDSYLFQTLENKQRFISQIMTSKSPVRSCEDVDEQALSYAEIKALCAGNPLIKEKMDLDVQVAKLKVLKADHQSQKFRLQDKLLTKFPADIQETNAYIAGVKADAQLAATHPQVQEGFCGMTIKGVTYDEKKTAGERLVLACSELPNAEEKVIGSYRGFELSLRFDTYRSEYQAILKGQRRYPVALGTDPLGNIIRLDNSLNNFPERINSAENELATLHQQQAAAQIEVEKPFPQEEELAEKSARLAELNAQLDVDEKNHEPEQDEEEQEDTPRRPSVLAALEEKTNKPEPVKPFRSYYDKDGDAR